MNPINNIWQNVEDALRLHDQDTQAIIHRICQEHYYNLCGKTDWEVLRRTTEVTLDATETDGVYLPSNLIDITSVLSEDNERQYFPCKESQQLFGEAKYRWFNPDCAVTPLENPVQGINISQNATTFTAKTAFSADHTGEYVRFDAEPGLYEITKSSATFKTMTITPSYKGDKITNKSCVVRPEQTRKICLINTVGTLIADTVTVHYWEYPEPLYQKYQVPILPTTRALELLTLITILGTMDKKRTEANEYKDELNGRGSWVGHGAMAELLRRNPIFPTLAFTA